MSVLGCLAGGGTSELAGWCGGLCVHGCSCPDVSILPEDTKILNKTLGHSILID